MNIFERPVPESPNHYCFCFRGIARIDWHKRLLGFMVAEERLELSRPRGHWLLRPACLPIPPPRLRSMLHSGPDWILASDCTYDRPEWPTVENVHAFGRGHALPTDRKS